MSVSNAIGTAAAVVGIGVAAAVGYRVFESARTAGQLNNAAADIRAAGGDPTALSNLMAALRSTGVLSPGGEGAAVSQGTNEQTQIQTTGVLYAAERTMLAAGSCGRLSRNLSVVRPKDVPANWRKGEGAWLPSQGAAVGFRTGPVSNVRGLDMNAYALVYLPDVYDTPSNGGAVVAYPKRLSYHKRSFYEGSAWKLRRNIPFATEAGLAEQFDIMITSTDQAGGLVALWDPRRARFLTPAESASVQFAINGTIPKKFNNASNADLPYYRSSFLRRIRDRMESHTKFQPFPPAIRGAQESALRTAPVERRGDGTAVR